MNLGDAHRTRRERAKREVITVVKKIVTADLVKVRQGGTPEESKEYLDVLSVGLKCPTADLVEVRQGGTPEELKSKGLGAIFSRGVSEKGCPVVVDTLGEKAGKNEFPAFF